MFKREFLYITAIRYNNQLKLEQKIIKNNEVVKTEISNYLVKKDDLPQNVVEKILSLQKNTKNTYISTVLLSDTTKLISKTLSAKIKDCDVAELNDNLDIVVLKTTLFETQNYFAKTGVDYIYSSFHVLNAFIKRNKPRSELLYFISNNKAFVVIVDNYRNIVYNDNIDLLTFDSVKKTHFYDDDLEAQKLFDELFFLELSQSIQNILNDFYKKQKYKVFVQKVCILYTLKILSNKQLSKLSQELFLKVEHFSINVDEEIFKLTKDKNTKTSFIKSRKKTNNSRILYIVLIIFFILLFLLFENTDYLNTLFISKIFQE